MEVIDLTDEPDTTILIDDSVIIQENSPGNASPNNSSPHNNSIIIQDECDENDSVILQDDFPCNDSSDEDSIMLLNYDDESSSPKHGDYTSNNDNNKDSNVKTKQKETKRSRKEAKCLEIQSKRLESEANRANAASKALDNCTACIDKRIPNLINDSEVLTIKTLFDESLVKHRLLEFTKIDNSITWTYRRTEIVDGACVARYRDAPWIIIIMTGSEYLEKLLAYKQDPNSRNSIKTYLENVRDRCAMDVILIVINLSNYLKEQRIKEAKKYRQTFKDRFEGTTEIEQATQNDTTTDTAIANLGVTDLQDLRLMLEMNFKREHPKWHLHVDFYEKTVDVIQAIIRYTLAVAKLELKIRAKTSTGLDWAINMDKEKSVDPTKSSEDLTKLWTTQLQQFAQVTLPIAKAIATEYPSPYALLSQYEELSQSEAENLLAELRVQKNLRRQIGLSISKRIHCLMTCKNPNVHVGLN